MNVPAIRDGLKTACVTVDGLRGADTIPERIDGPTAVIEPDDTHTRGDEQFITYNDAMAGGLTSLHFSVVLYVPLSKGFDRAQDTLDGYLSAGASESGTSVVDALNSASINGVDHVLVRSARAYGRAKVSETDLATATLSVVVRTNRR